VEVGQAEGTPEQLNTPGRRALYNNIYSGLAEPTAAYGQADKDEALALTIRIVQAKEQVIKAALYRILQNVSEVERIFFIIAQHKEY